MKAVDQRNYEQHFMLASNKQLKPNIFKKKGAKKGRFHPPIFAPGRCDFRHLHLL